MSFYKYITDQRKDSADLKKTMEDTVKNLLNHSTDELKPGILLGMIQSGKTRAFTGIIAKCFDEGYDLAIVLTKNSVALVDQTMKRLRSEFKMPVERNRLYVWDVIKLQDGQLTGYILKEKNIIVVKKEHKNMEALESLFDDIPELHNKRILIVDDEADQASVSFYTDKNKTDGIDVGSVASSISKLRKTLKKKASYLQVTATPYSLYLQPENLNLNKEEFAPQRPAFTNILNPHPAYIGGEYYFEKSTDMSSPASYLHVMVEEDELDLLNFTGEPQKNDYDKRLKDNLLNTPKLKGIRDSIFNYLVGGAIRQQQEHDEDFWNKPYHSAFLVHTSSFQRVHNAQKGLVTLLVEKLSALTKKELDALIKPYYQKLGFSIRAAGLKLPAYADVLEGVSNALINKHVGIVEVNSEVQISALLGDDGQLRLDNPFNIFVGGQSLDRGITIDHLIGFFYGRNPDTFQMDTVLQHSRMYGSRSIEDLSVTRFYTTAHIYASMKNMYYFDKDLREDIIKYGDKATVRFIAKKGTQIIPSGPGKLRASYLFSFKAFSRMCPSGFQTRSNTDIKKSIQEIDDLMLKYGKGKESFTMPYKEVEKIIKMIRETFSYEPRWQNVGLEWDTLPVLKAIQIGMEKNKTDEVIIYHKTGREVSRKQQDSTFRSSPEDGNTDVPICKNLAKKGPVLMLLKQKGQEKDKGWRDAPFYWPVLMMPANMPNYVFTEEK